MDQFLLAAAGALVAAMATDGWNEAHKGVVALWRRVHPDRVPAIESELADVRKELLASREVGDVQVEKDLVSDWQRKLRRLTAVHPELEAELQRLMEEWDRLLPGSGKAAAWNVQQTAIAAGDGSVYQAGRDQRISGA